ncbi:hypothetical protein SRHO_G00312040 [Serrasalmus rhombeus]
MLMLRYLFHVVCKEYVEKEKTQPPAGALDVRTVPPAGALLQKHGKIKAIRDERRGSGAEKLIDLCNFGRSQLRFPPSEPHIHLEQVYRTQ